MPNVQAPPVSGHRSSFDRLRRWSKRTFTPRFFRDYGQTLLWTIPLTLLIWIYADREQRDTQLMPLKVEAENVSDSDRLVTLREPSDNTIRVEFRGSRSALEKFRKELEEQSFTVPLRPPEGAVVGNDVNVSILEQIRQEPRLRDSGLELTRTIPATGRLYVDKIIEELVPVQLPDGEFNLVRPPVFDPPSVSIRGPQEVIERLRAEGQLHAVVSMDRHEDLFSPGGIKSDRLPLLSPAPGSVVVKPGIVTVTMEVSEQREEEYEINSLPVWVVKPAVLEGTFYYQVQSPTLTNVRVIGPPDAINAIRRDSTLVKPLLVVSDSNTQSGSHVLLFKVPDDVRVLSINGAPAETATIDFESRAIRQ